MESKSKSGEGEKSKSKNSPPKKKSKSSNKPSHSSSVSASTSSSKQNQSGGKSDRHSDHNDKRDRYHYHNHHKNRKDNRPKKRYNSNYNSGRDFNNRPYNSYKNRVWNRSYSNSKNNHYQNYNRNNFQRDNDRDYYNNHQHPSHQQYDSFQNFQTDVHFENQDRFVIDQLPISPRSTNAFQFSEELPQFNQHNIEGVGIDQQNQEIVFNLTEFPTTLDTNSEPEREKLKLENTGEIQRNENDQLPSDPFEPTYDNALQGLLTNETQLQFEQSCNYYPQEFSENPDPSTNLLFANVKPEPEELEESEFNLGKCINSNNRFPSISVVPISRLIKGEIQDLNRTDIIAPTTPSREKRSQKPNLVQRRKNLSKDGSLTENIVQRVANMDKIGIKNVINSPGTKFDEALKIQARKRLREEIRKQLKTMNFKPPADNENNVLIPDEIVDSMNIPAVVLDEIRKAFGIVLVEDKNQKMSDAINAAIEKPITSPKPTETAVLPNDGDVSPKSPDLRSRLKMLEESKSHTEKQPKPKETKTRPSKPVEPILVSDSSSSSSSESSSSSDSDSSSTSSGSNCSNSSSFKRRRRNKRILEANVVGNFEKLILPNLTAAQRRRYKEKYSKTTKNSLQYIYGVCVSRANRNKSPSDEKEQQKIKQNLSSADNAQALEFLMKAILNLFEKQKETLKKRREKKTQNKSPNSVNASASKLKDTTCKEDDKALTKRKNKSADSEESSKHQSTSKLDEPSGKGRVNKKQEDSIAKCANSASRVSSVDDGDRAPVAQEVESDTESTSENNPPSKQWKSPGETKCIESTSDLSNLDIFKSKTSLDMETAMSNLGMMQSPLGNFSIDIDSLKSQSSIGDEAVSSIREIDVKLMELHKRKMYIEEMILKLQKDKMEVDLWTMKLQNEKFILLNSALASASSSCSKAPLVKRKVLPISLATSKLQNHNKRDLIETINNIVMRKRTKRKSNSSIDEENSEKTAISEIKKIYKNSPILETCAEDTSKQDSPIQIDEEEKEEKDVKTVVVPQYDYSNVENGNLEGWKLPITQIIVIGEAIIAASEDGNIYKFNIRTRVLESKFSKHTEAITQIYACPKENFVYTTSLDGFVKKTSLENFGLELQSLNLQEPLQSIDIEWGITFIGSRWGNIFTYDIKHTSLSESLLCSAGSSIIAIKATKEGPRKILIVSSKGNQINFRDAMTGLLLRSLDISDSLHIYSILLDDSSIYCGTQRNEIHQYNFTTGGRLAILKCGNGAVSMKMYKEKYIFVGCYDGFVYVLNKKTGCQIGRFPGSGKMILALEIAGDKLITSAKDNTMQIVDIPKYISTIKDKS